MQRLTPLSKHPAPLSPALPIRFTIFLEFDARVSKVIHGLGKLSCPLTHPSQKLIEQYPRYSRENTKHQPYIVGLTLAVNLGGARSTWVGRGHPGSAAAILVRLRPSWFGCGHPGLGRGHPGSAAIILAHYVNATPQTAYTIVRHGSNALDTFVLVLRIHCQVGLALFEPCLSKYITLRYARLEPRQS